MNTPIIPFKRVREAYGWLSNMSPHPVTFQDVEWRTAEALFQALRFPADAEVREAIRASRSPMGAKMAAKAAAHLMGDRSDAAWIAADLDRMRLVLRVKLACHPALGTELLATGNATLVEDVSSRATSSGLFWGMAQKTDGSWYGQNWLGRLWAEARAELLSARAEQGPG